MTPLPRKPGRFQFTLSRLVLFMLLGVFFVAYTSWWIGRLRREQEKTMRAVVVARQQEAAARARAEAARDQAQANLVRAQQVQELMRVIERGNDDSAAQVAPEIIRSILLRELHNPTVPPGALDLSPDERLDWIEPPDE